MSTLRQLPITRAGLDQPDTVEALQARISTLTSERQELRARRADTGELERNRLEIARLQWLLSHALIERHLPRPAHEHAA